MTYHVEQRFGTGWAGVFPARSREEAAAYMAGNPDADLRVTDSDGRILTYADAQTILQVGETAPLPSSREGRRLREHGYTVDQKREAREAHRALLADALAALETPGGMSAFLVSREIHGNNLTPGNIALAALQCPGQLVGTRAAWKREGMKLRKGQGHCLRLTGASFWPVAAWTLKSFGGEMPPLPTPDATECSRLASSWETWPDHSVTGLTGWLADTDPQLIEGEPVRIEREEVPIPF